MLSEQLAQAARELESRAGGALRCHVQVKGAAGDRLFLVALEGAALAVRLAWALACDQPRSSKVVITLPDDSAPLMSFSGQQALG